MRNKNKFDTVTTQFDLSKDSYTKTRDILEYFHFPLRALR